LAKSGQKSSCRQKAKKETVEAGANKAIGLIAIHIFWSWIARNSIEHGLGFGSSRIHKFEDNGLSAFNQDTKKLEVILKTRHEAFKHIEKVKRLRWLTSFGSSTPDANELEISKNRTLFLSTSNQ